MDVREAHEADAEAVFPLAQAFATSYVPGRQTFLPGFERIIRSADAAIYVAVIDGSIAGYVLIQRHDTLFANGPTAYVQELMVGQAHRRSGAGTLVMAAAERRAQDSGCVYVSLATRRASGFYRAIGYDESAAFFKKQLVTELPPANA